MREPRPLAKLLIERMEWKRSRAYLYASGQRTPTLDLALDIHQKTGAKLGPIEHFSDAQIRGLRNANVRGEAA